MHLQDRMVIHDGLQDGLHDGLHITWSTLLKTKQYRISIHNTLQNLNDSAPDILCQINNNMTTAKTTTITT
jgi:hypothetical protein